MTPEEFEREWLDPGEYVTVHTSGSTGNPKAMRVEKRRMAASARTTCDFLGLRPGDTALLCMSTDYIAGKMMMVRAFTRHLKLTVTEPSSHPLSEIGSADFDLAAMVPLQVYHSLSVPSEREKLASIRHLIIGGGALDSELEAQLREFPNAVWCSYGMTETLSHIALRRVSGETASEYYTPLQGVRVYLDSEGCIVIDAPAVCATTLTTNDIGEMAPDGVRFKVLGRKDNVICSGGLKFRIEEMESLLRPAMNGIPFLITKRRDAQLGEAAVILIESDLPEAEATARQAAEQTLERHMRPRHYIRVDHLPTTPTGKPARAAAIAIAEST